MSISRIGILTSGGDCPGLNAVISGVARSAAARNWSAIGFRDGFEGLLGDGDYLELLRSNISGIMHLEGLSSAPPIAVISAHANAAHIGRRWIRIYWQVPVIAWCGSAWGR